MLELSNRQWSTTVTLDEEEIHFGWKNTLENRHNRKIKVAIIESNRKQYNRNNRRIVGSIIEIESNREIP